jgi:hypothetical protein
VYVKQKQRFFDTVFKKICLFQNRDADCICIELHDKRKEDAGQKPGIPPNSRKTYNHIPRKYSIEQSVTQTII